MGDVKKKKQREVAAVSMSTFQIVRQNIVEPVAVETGIRKRQRESCTAKGVE